MIFDVPINITKNKETFKKYNEVSTVLPHYGNVYAYLYMLMQINYSTMYNHSSHISYQ